jgi:hypothetical protein
MLKLVLLSNSYLFLPHTGETCNQPVELAKDWRSDCLEKQNLLVAEICEVLGMLHSSQGLAQSNNNAKLKSVTSLMFIVLMTSPRFMNQD